MCIFRHALRQQEKFFKWNIETKHEQKKSLSFAIQIAISRALFSVLWSAYFYSLMNFPSFKCVCMLSSHACMRPFDILKATGVDVGIEDYSVLFFN